MSPRLEQAQPQERVATVVGNVCLLHEEPIAHISSTNTEGDARRFLLTEADGTVDGGTRMGLVEIASEGDITRLHLETHGRASVDAKLLNIFVNKALSESGIRGNEISTVEARNVPPETLERVGFISSATTIEYIQAA